MEIQDILVARSGMKRRTFIKGIIASGATASSMSYLFRGNEVSAQSAPGAVETMVRLNVNGQTRPVDVLPQETLGTTLRYKLGLTGTKYGCDRAECGACTVLVDNVPHYSCSMLTQQVRGRQVRTIEGLAQQDGTLHPVQQAVMQESGFQCAFCSSGFIMSMVGMLEKNANPTRPQVREALAGNLCRCGDYDKIMKSAMRAVELNRAAEA